DGKERVDTAVSRSIAIHLEAHFPHRPIAGYEGWNPVARAKLVGDGDLRIEGRTGPARRREAVASAATVHIEPRTQPVRDIVHLLKSRQSAGEGGEFRGCQSWQWAAGGTASAHTG